MLESIRKHSKFVMYLLFLLIIPGFVFMGIDNSYFSGSSPVVARVDGKDITQAEWDNAHRIESDRLRAEQPNIDAKLLDSAQARYATLERMVRDLVFQTAAQKMHLMVSDATLARTLQEIPAIASLRKADGSLDAEGYRNLLAAQGLTPEGFEASVRRDLALGQVLGGVMGSTLAAPSVADLALDAMMQRREIQVAMFAAKDFAAKVQPSDADLKAYYEQHQAQFEQAEQASIEYVVLDLDAVRKRITLNEDDLRTYYKENGARLAGVQQERRVSHILIEAPKSQESAQRDAAKAKAQELLARVQADPSSFAAVAKEHSQDQGSAAQGGDLGFFGRGAMVPEFERAAFALKKGQLSDVVETEFGYHILLVTDVKEPEVPSFETLRPQIEDELKGQMAMRQFAEEAENFTNTVYEESESLAPVAEKLDLKVQTAEQVQRQPKAGSTGPLANERFLEALFESDSLQNKRNTDAVEFGTNQLVAGRITNYTPAKQLSLEEVRDQVQALYVAQQAAQLAQQEGAAQLAAWKQDASQAKNLQPAVIVSRDNPQGLAPQVLSAALQAPVQQLPAWEGVALGDQGYAIVQVKQVMPKEERPADLGKVIQAQYEQLYSLAEGAAYYDALKKKFDVQFKVRKP